jgi:hypothetical protein
MLNRILIIVYLTKTSLNRYAKLGFYYVITNSNIMNELPLNYLIKVNGLFYEQHSPLNGLEPGDLVLNTRLNWAGVVLLADSKAVSVQFSNEISMHSLPIEHFRILKHTIQPFSHN